MASKYFVWKDGQTYGILAYDASKYAHGVLVTTNNGEQWSATLRPYPINYAIAPELMPAYVRLSEIRSLIRAEPEFRLPLEWAKRTVVEPGKIYTTPAGKLLDTRVIEYTSPATRHLGSVSYIGFERISKKSGHSLESIHRAVNSAVARAIEVWSWQCRGLEVKFHEEGRAFGLAYKPGSGKDTGVRKISLNALLLESYDLNSVARVVIHELCHHYRDETWPPDDSRPHDKLFCDQLVKADPEIAGSSGSRSAGANRCIKFADIPDTALEAARREKIAARTTEPTWAPEAGTLEYYILKSGQLRMQWRPKKGFSWTQWIQPMRDSSVLELMKHFGPHDWANVVVNIEPRLAQIYLKEMRVMGANVPYEQMGPVMSLRGWVEWIIWRYPDHTLKTRAYVEEALGKSFAPPTSVPTGARR